jgi:hypothetical protein
MKNLVVMLVETSYFKLIFDNCVALICCNDM